MYDDDYDDAFEDETTIECPNCGSSVYEDAPQCPSCGEYITHSRRNQSPWIYVITIVIIAILILSMGFFDVRPRGRAWNVEAFTHLPVAPANVSNPFCGDQTPGMSLNRPVPNQRFS